MECNTIKHIYTYTQTVGVRVCVYLCEQIAEVFGNLRHLILVLLHRVV